MSKDFYSVLGVSSQADAVVVRAAYRALSQMHHPDKAGAERKDEATRRMAEINEAFQTLGDPELRRAYDAERSAGQCGTERPPHSRWPTPATSAFSPAAFCAVTALSILIAMAFSFEKKPWWRIAWEFVAGGFVEPLSHVFHGWTFVFIVIIGLVIARRAAHAVAGRS